MIVADFFSELLGSSCVFFFLILWGIGWAISSLFKKAGDVVKSEEFQEGVKLGFWAWFLGDDD